MSENAFVSIANTYKESVKEQDESGYAEKFKICADVFFNKINDEFPLGESPVHFEDVKYLDGYFIFGFGTNSVVHFHIKECPGWLFGVWWNIPDDPDSNGYIKGDFFAQYEDTIDKFKPSRSEFCASISVMPEGGQSYNCYLAVPIIKFIRNEPYLAFCRDYLGWNYNEEYHTREEAKEKYDDFLVRKANEETYTKILDEKIVSFIKEKILPCFAGSELIDRGEDWRPKYSVEAPINMNRDIVDEKGHYDWFDKDDEDGKRIMEEFDALVKECNEISDKHEVFWSCPCHSTIWFYEKTESDKQE